MRRESRRYVLRGIKNQVTLVAALPQADIKNRFSVPIRKAALEVLHFPKVFHPNM